MKKNTLSLSLLSVCLHFFLSSQAFANSDINVLESHSTAKDRNNIQTQSIAENKDTPKKVKTIEQLKTQIPAFTATYSILRKSDPVGTGIRQLAYLDDGTIRYSYKTDLEWFIFSDSREETSIVSFANSTVTPIHYTYTREGTGKDKSYEWQFDAENNAGRDIKKKRNFELPFSQPLQDTLSYHLQHRITMMNAADKKSYIYPVVKLSGNLKDYEYTYDGNEELILPYGLIKTIRLKREAGSKKKRVTYAWFAPELNYLLVKLYQTKNGNEQFEAQLKALSIEK